MEAGAFHRRFASTAAARAGSVALVTDTRSWTYGELVELSRHCARQHLAALPPGAAFGWLGLNSAEMLAALLACATHRVRFVPLNWRLSGPELQAIARHAGLAAWHADEGMMALSGLQGGLGKVASIDTDNDNVAGANDDADAIPDNAAGNDAARNDPAQRLGDLLLVYTSGTTGAPKGALHTQQAMLANVDAAIATQDLNASTRTLAALPMFHVGGLCIQVLPTLMAGGTVRLHGRFDAQRWLHDVEHWHATTSLMVPATLRAVVEHGQWAGARLESLQSVVAGSSIVPHALIDAFHARGVPVMQVYGATETGPVTLVLRAEDARQHVGTVGRPAPGVTVRLVDGELHVRAPNLARAYHRRAGDAAFADGWFRTGDLARVDAHGCYEILGRRDDLIISGGENIDPAAIEALVQALPGVAECAVVGVDDARWGQVPVLAVVLADAARLTAQDLRVAYVDRLARFGHPVHTFFVASLPKTALGKVQRAALRHMLQQRIDDAGSS